ncbi:MAG: HAD family hydrolase [Rhabdochlamydiaceae bacterium]
MEWIESFDLFLFDFDGLLVDTEELHFRAYQQLCQKRGYILPWDINQFFEIAHADAVGIRKSLQILFPKLFEDEASWDTLYTEKKKIYEALLQSGNLSLLPGVEPLLEKLAQLNKKRCVVTNSTLRQTELVKSQIPVLQTIPRWFTRESYDRPKPAPDGYLKALSELKSEGDRDIGFEDSMRGYAALKAAGVSTPVLVCPSFHPQLQLSLDEKKLYVSSLNEMPTLFLG